MPAPMVALRVWLPAPQAQDWGPSMHRAGDPAGQPSALKP